MIEVCSLASGSKGNAFFVKTGPDAFLIDAGISCKQICTRLEHIQHNPGDIKGIFITHEHSDHVKGLRVLLKRFPIPVYITEKTYSRLDLTIGNSCLNLIESNDSLQINSTTVRALPKNHDAIDPALFCFYYKNKKISVITDAGTACHNVKEAVKDADVLFLESNYDEAMLWDGFYPDFLKKRIHGNLGHLSNNTAAALILEHASANLDCVFLSHLSENNNLPEIALGTFLSTIKKRKDLGNVKTILTSHNEISPKIKIKAAAMGDEDAPGHF